VAEKENFGLILQSLGIAFWDSLRIFALKLSRPPPQPLSSRHPYTLVSCAAIYQALHRVYCNPSLAIYRHIPLQASPNLLFAPPLFARNSLCSQVGVSALATVLVSVLDCGVISVLGGACCSRAGSAAGTRVTFFACDTWPGD
jgi:hypothetical protein